MSQAPGTTFRRCMTQPLLNLPAQGRHTRHSIFRLSGCHTLIPDLSQMLSHSVDKYRDIGYGLVSPYILFEGVVQTMTVRTGVPFLLLKEETNSNLRFSILPWKPGTLHLRNNNDEMVSFTDGFAAVVLCRRCRRTCPKKARVASSKNSTPV